MTTPFISAADLVDYLRLSVTDDLVTIALDAGCQAVVDYLGFDPNTQSVSEDYDGTGGTWLALKGSPVTTMTSVRVYDADFSTYEDLVEGTDYVADLGRAILWRFDGGVFDEGRQNVSVSYTYGYATVPSSIRLVALQVAARIYDVGQVTQESLGGYSVTYAEGGGALTDAERLALYPYRRAVV